MRSRGFQLTINNWTPDDQKALEEVDCQYVAYSEEIAPTTGTPHLQGFIYFKNQRSFKAVKKLFPRAHVEVIRGTFAQNKAYCSKQGELIERGVAPKDPRETGIDNQMDEALEAAKENRMEDIPAGIMIRYYANLQKIRQDNMKVPEDLDGPCGWWIWGVPRAGKSYWVRQEFGHDLYVKDTTRWWSGYDGEENVLIEEVSPENARELGYYLKIWMDAYSFKGEVKGGYVALRPKNVIVTSNFSIYECFGQQLVTCEAIELRCKDRIKHFDKRWGV